MKEFLIEALNSAVGERLADGLFVCAVVMLIQYFYNKKLAEHQIQFKYWHEEKAKAIKEFYYSIIVLYHEMRDYCVIAGKFSNQRTVEIQKILDEKLIHINQLDNSFFRDWLCLRLFLKDEELTLVQSFYPKEQSIFQKIITQYQNKEFATDSEEKDLDDLLLIIEEMRIKLQDILKAQDTIDGTKKQKECKFEPHNCRACSIFKKG